MSALIYNDVEIDYIKTQSVEQEAVYTPDGRQYLYTRFKIHVRGLVTLQLSPTSGMGADTASALTQIASVREELLKPGQVLQFTVNSYDLLTAELSHANDDIRGGPYPRFLNIVEIVGTEAVVVDYVIETYINECLRTDTNLPAQVILSNRFSESIQIDENFYSTKTRRGTVIVAGTVRLPNPDASVVRKKVIPPVVPGFRRVSISWEIQEDGFAANYTVVDQEVYLMPPAPAVRAEGTYTEMLESYGSRLFGECQITLWGAKTSDKRALLAAAIQIAVNKCTEGKYTFADNAVNPNKLAFLQRATLRESLFENRVDVTVRVWIQKLSPSTRGPTVALPLYLGRFGTDLPGVDKKGTPPDPGIRGSAGLLLQIADTLDSCAYEDPDNRVRGGAKGIKPDGAGAAAQAKPNITIVQQVKQAFLGIFQALIGGTLYTEYDVQVAIQNDSMITSLPVAGPIVGGALALLTQTANAQSKLTVNWTATRVGRPPVVPTNKPPYPGLTLVSWSLQPAQIDVMADGTKEYRLFGKYVYEATTAQDTPDHPVPPWLKLTPSEVETDFKNFYSGIVAGGGTNAKA